MFGYLDAGSKLNTQGIGMGLHITKSIVEQFGGKCFVKSTVGVGSTFGFEFILRDSLETAAKSTRLLNTLFARRRNQLRIKRIVEATNTDVSVDISCNDNDASFAVIPQKQVNRLVNSKNLVQDGGRWTARYHQVRVNTEEAD